jgi:predicted lipoprotein with Yx(FWY)xxD motif
MGLRRITSRSARRAACAAALAALVAAPLAAVPAGASTRGEVVVRTLKTSSYGTILVTTKGYPLYTYASDSTNHSNCNGSCLAGWPALSVPAGVRPEGVAGLGAFTRSSGERQVTFHGRPLYTFVNDTRDHVTGQGVSGFSVATLSAAGHSATPTTVASGGGW